MPSRWPKSNPHCPKVLCPVVPLPKLRYLRGQWPQPRPVPTRPRQPTESPSCQNSFPFSLTKSSRFQLRNNKHGGRRGNLFPQHFNEENTHGDANAAAVRCLPILLPPGLILILLPAGIVQGCAEPPAAPAPASRGGLGIPNPAAWDAQGTGHCQGWAAGTARRGMGSRKRGGNLQKLAGGNFALIF